MQFGAPILTASQMQAAEQDTARHGLSLSALMAAAGTALGDLAFRVAAGRTINIIVGPGNNGGDGYVAAGRLAALRADVVVSALAEPATKLAKAAKAGWAGPVGSLADPAIAGSVLVDCLFGTGLNRPIGDEIAAHLARHAYAANRRIAADLPSGLSSDDGLLLGCPYRADVTLAFGALKPAHVLFPAAAHCGIVRLAEIGIGAQSIVRTIAMPALPPPDHTSHKYRRGLVAVIAGDMAGAAELAARAAARSGAGYVLLIGGKLPATGPFAIVRRGWREGQSLDDDRISSIVIGPGLGSGEGAKQRLTAALSTGKPLVLDADALAMLPSEPFTQPVILTPHSGEFDRICHGGGDKISRTRALAERTGAVVLHKGPDTVIAAPDGRVAVHAPGNYWLSSAGTGDVLAGICGAMLARGLEPFEAAQAAVLLHQRAADRAGQGLIADDLVDGANWL